ncbi:helix-turn-helix domain-containing protein [Actinomadura geliboluensis]|nr:helix-turn-helix transcriptional regulator [Actinomadura geliboluensis]
MRMAMGGGLTARFAAELRADQSAGGTIPRLVLGARLRWLRATSQISEVVAAQVVGSQARLNAMEAGIIRSRLHDVIALCDLYQVDEHATRVSLLELARQGQRGGWWQAYRPVIPEWFLPYLGIEQAADVIRCYAVVCVPDLLQTDTYARAHIDLVHPDAPPAENEMRVRLRMQRQQRVLGQGQGAQLWAILDEAALRRSVGGKAVMFRQLEHLLEVNDRPNVTIQVIPFAASGHVALSGPITLLRSQRHDVPDMVYLEHLAGVLYPDRASDCEYYRHALNGMAVQALPPHRTSALLVQMINSL